RAGMRAPTIGSASGNESCAPAGAAKANQKNPAATIRGVFMLVVLFSQEPPQKEANVPLETQPLCNGQSPITNVQSIGHCSLLIGDWPFWGRFMERPHLLHTRIATMNHSS